MPDRVPKVGRRRPAPTPESHTETAKPNPYPHRVTLDLSDEMYDRLRAEAFRTHKRLSEIGREALDAHLPDLQNSVSL